MSNIQDLMRQLHASLVSNELEAAIKAKLEALQAEVVRLGLVIEEAVALNMVTSKALECKTKQHADALTQITTMQTQKPCAAISRCSLNGAADCSCSVSGPCESLTDVYLSAGALPQTSEQCKVSPVSSRGCELGTKGCETRHTNGGYFFEYTSKES